MNVPSMFSFRPSDAMTHYNNPPAHLVVVDDAGNQTGHFQIGVPAPTGPARRI